ncbi:phosphatidate cytidylyltransferase [Sporobolomyces salmoneus]|uniref:phosphatidate cytidylyltransferase n=1 Tax=Sporobolomyces salmoneus TaxID=183962 RepID=UPI003174C05E
MARGKSVAVGNEPTVASAGRFDALALQAGSDSEDEVTRPAAATSTSFGSATSNNPLTPSKKALARQRAKLRKQSSSNLNGIGDESEASSIGPASSSIPPVPALPKLEINGTTAEKVVKETVQAKDKLVEQIKEAVPTKAAESIPPSSSVSESDIESQYDDDDDEDDDEDDEMVAPTGTANGESTPTPSSPQIASRTPAASSVSTKPKEAYTGADHDPNKKLKAVIQRTVWGVFMAAGCIGLVAMGHVYVVALVFIIQAVVFRELTGLFDAGYSGAHVNEEGKMARSPEKEAKRRGRKEERERWSRRMAWYFFAATNYYLYGESLIYYFKHILTLQASFLPTAYSFAQHHRLISFGLYVIGFVGFVANLSRANLRRQFGLFGWIHMSLLLIVVSSHFIVNNILEGMIWFWIPVSLVIMNDIAAYVCGMLFGRHQLIKLSPKKTVEGFVGAFFVTVIFAVGWSTLFMRYNYMICPVQDLSTSAFSKIQCTPNHVFEWKNFRLPASVLKAIEPITRGKITSIPWAPFQLHSIVLATFASLVAPFGGFFASGFKRAFNIKDFGDSIPGHGGMTDRMDCQFLMGLFSYVYYASLIRETHVTPQSVLAVAMTHLTTDQQVELVKALGTLLSQKGIKVGY